MVTAYKYGLTLGTYRDHLQRFGSACQICHTPYKKTPCVDHDHATGVFRGLLCTNCNSGLGLFKDNPDALRAAANYLEHSKRSHVA